MQVTLQDEEVPFVLATVTVVLTAVGSVSLFMHQWSSARIQQQLEHTSHFDILVIYISGSVPVLYM